jgi:hypothetical protein
MTMATSDPLPEAALRSVAGQLAGLVSPVPDSPAVAAERAGPPAGAELAESYAVCFVEVAQVRRPPVDLSALARPSGVWHHQVRTGGEATHIARSVQSGFAPAELGVEQAFASPLAGQIERAAAWVDRHVKGRARARLLAIPAYYVHALLLVRGDRYTAVLADQPSGFARLEYEREYPLSEFLKLLAKEKPSGNVS